MKRFDETQNYIESKKKIFSTLIDAISTALQEDKPKIYVKHIKILEEEVDVIADRDDWPKCLEKAISFFESTEDYEACQVCSELLDKLKKPTKNKKTRKNGGKK
jgi:hypothetical protein